ncbi:uncharacterized protein LOC108697552 isoform X2 [Xenopus laevis]|uniref:Uncharacterized protein LOC108697552 isoform X2 n=1 Tax=Xenopus laevis TaxID=8355 RepID=A0A8J0TFT6_XENLA|nr:uncharacterized protein LOC108697552 isoform X2 [Xenopus laevis]
MALRSCWLFGILLLYLRSVKGEEKDIFMNGTINRNITLPSAPFESMGEWFFYGQVKDLKTENKKSLFYTDNKFPDKLHNATNTRVRPGANGSLVIKYLCKEDEGLYLFEYDDSKRYIHLSLFDEEQKNITGNSTDLGISPITTSSAAGNQYKWKIWIMIAVCCAGCCLVFGLFWLKKRRNLKKAENKEQEEREQNKRNLDIETGNNNGPAGKKDIATLDACKMETDLIKNINIIKRDDRDDKDEEDMAEVPLLEGQNQKDPDLKDSTTEAEDTELNIDQESLALGCSDTDQTNVDPMIYDNREYSPDINNGDKDDINHSPNITDNCNISEDPGILDTTGENQTKHIICNGEGTKINAIKFNIKEETIELMASYPAENEGNSGINIPNRNLSSF